MLASLACASLLLASPACPAAHAMPTIPDDSPLLSSTARKDVENPSITVTDLNGQPLAGPVHRGDELLVHGTGFNPQANRGGYILPAPPGTPNGVWVLYSAFPTAWKPSEGAPASNRTHPHSAMAWVMPAGTLESIPAAPIDMRRSIAREAQPMGGDGTFTARITVDPPEHTPGDQWGVYVYAAGGSVNAAEEIFVPIPFSAEPGPRTPAAPTGELSVRADWLASAVQATRGTLSAREGAAMSDGRATFSREADLGDGIRRYRGTVTAAAKYNVVEIAVRNPWLTPLGGGLWTVSAEVSQGISVGADAMARVDLGVIREDEADPVRIG